MALPIHTTLITISRADAADAFDLATFSVISSETRAHIGSVGGAETVTSGSSETRTAHLSADPVDLKHGDRVYDETTQLTYEVTWAALRTGLGLDHTTADLLLVVDRAAV